VQLERECLVREVVGGVDGVVSDELEQRSVQGPGSAPRHYVDLREPAAAILGGEPGSSDLELGDSFDRRERVRRSAANDHVRVVSAVDTEGRRRAARAIDR